MTGVIIALAAAATALGALVAILWARADRIGREAGRLGRLAAQQATELDQLRGADVAVMDRLPDPLILLDKARTVQRANVAARTAFGADIRRCCATPDCAPPSIALSPPARRKPPTCRCR